MPFTFHVRITDHLVTHHVKKMAERTGLEPATPGVTGRYSNQLNYRSALNLIFIDRRLVQSGP